MIAGVIILAIGLFVLPALLCLPTLIGWYVAEALDQWLDMGGG